MRGDSLWGLVPLLVSCESTVYPHSAPRFFRLSLLWRPSFAFFHRFLVFWLYLFAFSPFSSIPHAFSPPYLFLRRSSVIPLIPPLFFPPDSLSPICHCCALLPLFTISFYFVSLGGAVGYRLGDTSAQRASFSFPHYLFPLSLVFFPSIPPTTPGCPRTSPSTPCCAPHTVRARGLWEAGIVRRARRAAPTFGGPSCTSRRRRNARTSRMKLRQLSSRASLLPSAHRHTIARLIALLNHPRHRAAGTALISKSSDTLIHPSARTGDVIGVKHQSDLIALNNTHPPSQLQVARPRLCSPNACGSA
jgi:hypothetical protein